MKKFLVILLSLMMFISTVSAVALFTQAEESSEVYANSIEIIMKDGTTIYLGAQPIYEDVTTGEGDAAVTTKKITGYDANNVLSILSLEKGLLVFDHTTGTLTMTDVEGVAAIKCYTGSLVVVVKGTNTLENTANNSIIVNYTEYVDPEAETKVIKSVGNLTIKGDGVLNATSAAYSIVSQSGNLEITDNVTVNAVTTSTTSTADAIHTATNIRTGTKILIGGNAKVTATSAYSYAIRAQGADGGVYITGNADITVNAVNRASWTGGIRAGNFEMSGGKLTINVENEESKKAQAIMALDVQGGTAKFTGGTLTAKIDNKYNNRGYGLFFKNVSAVQFAGTNVSVDVKNATNSTANGIIAAQGTVPAIDISAGKFVINGDNNTTGMFGINVNNLALNISGGTFSGTAKSFGYSQGADFTLNITGGNFDITSTVSNFTFSNTSKKVTQTGSSAYAVDAAGTSIKVGTVGDVAPVSGTCSLASNAVLAPQEITAAPDAWATAVLKLADGTLVTVNKDAPVYVGPINVITLSGNGLSRALKEFDTAPAVPANVAVSAISKTGATVSWDAAEGATSYEVYLNGNKVATVSEVTSAVLADLTAATEYKVAVVGVNNVGSSEKSAEVSFKTGLEDVASTVTVTLTDGTAVELNSSKNSVAAGSGTVTLDSLTGTLTLENATAQSVIAEDGVKMTVVVKGTNVLESESKATLLKSNELIVDGDGVLTVNAKAEKSYAVLCNNQGGGGLTVQGNVTLTVNATAANANAAVHSARGTGESYIRIKGNAKVNVTNAGSRALYVAGEKSEIVITENAVVTLDSKNDAICALSDQDLAYEGNGSAYVEISGKANVVATAQSCGIRANYGMDCGTYASAADKNGSSEIVIKDTARVQISATGQVLYAVDAAKSSTGTNTAAITFTGTPTVKLTNTGTYAGIHLNSDKNTLTIQGGAIEVYAPEKTAFAVNGRTTYVLGENVTVMEAGADAESADGVTKINTTSKYFKIYYNNPSTSDIAVAPLVVMALLGAVAIAAAVVLRKRSCNE